MDYLQEGIGLRAMGQRDPLVEYQREGFDMFIAMMDAIKEEAVGFLYNVEVQTGEPAVAPPAVPADLVATGPGENPGEVMVEHLNHETDPEQALAAAPDADVLPDVEPATGEAARSALPDGFGRPERPAQLQYSGPAYDAAPGSTGVTTSADAGIGPAGAEAQHRNELCSCGSGRKYKRCHGDPNRT